MRPRASECNFWKGNLTQRRKGLAELQCFGMLSRLGCGKLAKTTGCFASPGERRGFDNDKLSIMNYER